MFADADGQVLQFGESLHGLAQLQPELGASEVHSVLQGDGGWCF
jgi:hypothetical protein